jgi:membrane protease YdiL (CAAX protease family)
MQAPTPPPETTSATAFVPPGTLRAGSKPLRWMELGLVLFVAFAQSLVISIYTLSRSSDLSGIGVSTARILAGVILEVGALAVLLYILFRQGRSVKDIGLNFHWADGPRSVVLAITGVVANYVFWVFLYNFYRNLTGHPPDATPRNVEFVRSFSWAGVFLVLINPWFEELIVRAYLISEVRWLSGSTVLAIAASVVLQSSYHLYQGVFPALIYAVLFLVFSIYYVRSGRILPVILAHFYFDAMAVFSHWR